MARNPWDNDPVVGVPSITVQPLPRNPYEKAKDERTEGRASRGEQREETRTGIAQSGEERAGRQERFGYADKLKADYDGLPEVKAYRNAIAVYAGALRSQPTPQGDLALIYSYAKLMDPTSVVREGEAASVANSDTIAGQITARLQKELGAGGTFSQTARDNLRREMQTRVSEYNRAYTQARQRFAADAQAYGVDPQRVIGPHAGAPFIKQIENYWQKRGGNAMQQDSTTAPPPTISGRGSAQKIPIPPDYQQRHIAYMQANKGNIDPNDYARFRAEEDRKMGLGTTPEKLEEYRRYAIDANKNARTGAPTSFRIPDMEMSAGDLQRFNSQMLDNKVGAAFLAAPPLAGGMDEIAGGMRSLVNGTPYSFERDRANAIRQTVADKYPGSTVTGGVLGGLATGVGVGMAAPSLAARGAGLVPSIGIGSLQGALENNQDRLGGAGVGAFAGAAGNLGGKYIAGPAFESFARRVDPRAPKLSPVDRAVTRQTPDFGQMRSDFQNAQRLGIPYALADASPELRALAGSTARMSPTARNLAENTFEPRSRAQIDRLEDLTNRRLASTTDIAERRGQLRQAGRTEAGPDYQMAFSHVAPKDPEIDAILKTDAGKRALRSAYQIAENDGKDAAEIGLIRSRGEVTLTQHPTVESIDYVKRAIDAELNSARDPISGKLILEGRPDLQSLNNMRSRLVSRMDELVPEYKSARAAFEKRAKQAENLQRGYDLSGKRLPARDLQRVVGDLTPDRLDELRRGYATGLVDQANDVRLAGNPYERIYGTPKQQEKIGLLFPEGAQDFGSAYNLERNMAKTAQEALYGSQTQPRAAADELFKSRGTLGDLATNATIDIATGSPGVATGLGLGRRLLQGARDRGRLGALGAERKAEQIAPRLFDTENPQSVIEYLDELLTKNAEIERRQRLAKQYGGLFGGLTGAGSISLLGGY